MGDVDDVGTVAVLHALADQGEVKGLRFVEDSPQVFGEHGLLVTRWSEPVGGDVAIEVDVSAGGKWTLGMAVDGDSFDGYRIIFAAPNYPNGISVDSIHPIECSLRVWKGAGNGGIAGSNKERI